MSRGVRLLRARDIDPIRERADDLVRHGGRAMTSAMHVRELAPGDVFVNHRIEGLAGRGGMGVVYRAIDLDLDRTVALKVIAPALADDPDFRARFVAESKAAASIEHPHVIPVYYAGEREGVLFIVMRYVDGPDLRALVRAEGRLDEGRAARVVAQVGGALDAAHAHGLVHRDVKPANVLLGGEDHAYLTDFGLTKRAASTAGLSRTGGWVGTLGFVAPEQIRDERVDARTDVYALGCVLVHALTGAAPFVRDCDEAMLWAHLHAPPPVDRVPEAFAGIVERALAKDPEDRFPSAGDLGRAALAAVGAAGAPGPERNVARGAAAPDGMSTGRVGLPPFPGETCPSPRDEPSAAVAVRRRRLRAIVVGALLLAAGALAVMLLGDARAPDRTTTERPAVGALASALPGAAPAPDRTTIARPADAARPVPVGSVRLAEPADGVAVADGRVWVLSSASGHVDVFDAVTGERRDRIVIGASPAPGAIAAGFGSIWTVKPNTRSLVRIGAQPDHRHLDTAIALPAAGSPDRLATGERAVWVAARNGAAYDAGGESIVRVDPKTLASRLVGVSGGVQHLAVGEGAVWVTSRFRPTVTRIDADDLDQVTIPVGAVPDAIAVGRGAVWVTAPSARAVVRISPATLRPKRIALRGRPTAVATAHRSVWVSAGGLVEIDPRTLRARSAIKAAAVPATLAASRGRVLWLTLAGRGLLQRIRV